MDKINKLHLDLVSTLERQISVVEDLVHDASAGKFLDCGKLKEFVKNHQSCETNFLALQEIVLKEKILQSEKVSGKKIDKHC